jgi:hypothetical protein
MTVPLPETGDGSRRRRREELQQRTRRRWGGGALAVVGLAVVLGLVYLIVGFATGDGDHVSGSGATSGASTSASDARAPSLVVLTDGRGAVYGVTILVPSASTIVHVPPGTLVEVPSLGLSSLQDAAREGGVALVANSLENVLGVRFAATATLDPAGIAAVVASVPALSVTLDAPVEERGAGGKIDVVVPAGTQTIAPDDAVRFLSVLGSGTSLQRIVRHQAFWTAYLSELGLGSPASAFGSTSQAVRALAGRTVNHTVLPVEAVDAELYRVVEKNLGVLVHRLFGVDAPTIKVQVLNGVGRPGLAQQVQPLLVGAGARVTLSANADRFDYAKTQVVYYDDDGLADAKAVRDALGVGELVKSLTGLTVVDVTVVVGADFVTAHPGG